MANLKDLRSRIKSVQSTKKITSAMKMISAAKLKKAQTAAESARPYANEMGKILGDLMSKQVDTSNAPKLIAGTGSDKKHLILLITSNRGLCGGFNSNVCRHAKKLAKTLKSEGKEVKLVIVGKKGTEILKREFGVNIVAEHISVTNPKFFNAEAIAADIVDRLDNDEFDVCTLVYNKFITALSQEITDQKLIPFVWGKNESEVEESAKPAAVGASSVYEYEPSKEDVLNSLLPRNIKVQIFRALLESTASEHGARMAAMDGATRNAEDMLGNLSITYNRIRQAHITSELTEIISGAEAL